MTRGQRRRVVDEEPGQLGDAVGVALDVDQHAGRVVEHEAGQAERDGVPVHERAEADALHGAGDAQAGVHQVGHGASADAGERVADEHVDDAGAAEAW